MALPVEVINQIFLRLSAVYMSEWDRLTDGQPIGNVKAGWAHELAGFEYHLDSITWALENLPEQAPNAIRFRNLCRQAPTPQAPRLEQPAADPARVAAELAKLQPLRSAMGSPGKGKQWAYDIVMRHQAGEKLRPIQLRLAREALRMSGRDDGQG